MYQCQFFHHSHYFTDCCVAEHPRRYVIPFNNESVVRICRYRASKGRCPMWLGTSISTTSRTPRPAAYPATRFKSPSVYRSRGENATSREITERPHAPSGVAGCMSDHSKTPCVTPSMDFSSGNG